MLSCMLTILMRFIKIFFANFLTIYFIKLSNCINAVIYLQLSSDTFLSDFYLLIVKMKTLLKAFHSLHLHNQRALATLLMAVCDERPLTRRPLTLRCTM